jgi:hypothetical protein
MTTTPNDSFSINFSGRCKCSFIPLVVYVDIKASDINNTSKLYVDHVDKVCQKSINCKLDNMCSFR